MPEPSSENNRPLTTLVERQSSSPLMGQFDKLKAEQEKIGGELDNQLVDVLRRWNTWKSTLPSWSVKLEDGNQKVLAYEIEATTDSGEQTSFIVSNYGGNIHEKDPEGKNRSTVFFRGPTEDPDDPEDFPDYGMIGYVEGEDRKASYGDPITGFRDGFASTAYGYMHDKWNIKQRSRYVAPGMEHLDSPMDLANKTLDKIQKGTVTKRQIMGDVWKPLQAAQPKAP